MKKSLCLTNLLIFLVCFSRMKSLGKENTFFFLLHLIKYHEYGRERLRLLCPKGEKNPLGNPLTHGNKHRACLPTFAQGVRDR